MGAKSLIRPASALYDEDFAAWAIEMARLLRARRLDDIDIEHLAEEIEDLANRDRRELLSRARAILKHLLEWQYQPEKRSRSWRSTIAAQRAEIDQLLEQSPSLRQALPASAPRVYRDAVTAASIETGLPEGSFPRECPFSPEQILDRRFLPDQLS
jgi:hypothetical protein